MQKGQIGVTTDNIFPVIKKFLYSDHEIFLRELVSNAVDATQKLKTLSSVNEFKGELGTLDVRITIDKEAGTLTVSDHGVGMTSEDIDRYINQIAFSGAEEFLEKYKESANAIIGHFGLGFYSAFMVAKKVEIHSLSYKEGAEAVKWSCDGSPEYTMENAEKTDRGTDIILYIDDDAKEFLEQSRIDTLLKKYCRFLPVPIISGKEQEWKDGKMVDTDRDKVINATEPRWTKKPSELTDDDYRSFYHELYPGQEDPLFWIHLNVDYPFTLTGILYFPKIKNNIEVTKNRIQLYCNQVFVTDSVEGVVPEFMMLMQGVIDSPDIPLNVSRSYLQSDTAVKKISSYITKKVSSRLDEMFKKDRSQFEEKWDDIKIFIEYGMLTDEKFAESSMKYMLLKDTDKKHFTANEYRELIATEQTDKNGDVICLYTTQPVEQYTYIQNANNRGYNVLVMDGQLDGPTISLLEQKIEKTRFVRVDSDTLDNLIVKNERRSSDISALERNVLTTMFTKALPKVEGANFVVTFESLNAADMPVILTQNEYMRRMKDMAAINPQMAFYGEMPDSYNMVVNTENSHIVNLRKNVTDNLGEQVKPLMDAIESINKEIDTLRNEVKDKADAEKDQRIKDLEKEVADKRKQQEDIAADYLKEAPVVSQLVDLALLANGLLKGASLSDFIRRSVDLL